MIEVQHLTKRYGPVTAVDDVSFKAERGEILGFLGPNGAGKTTTMRVLTGYMPATDGKAIVAGYDVLEQPVEAKRRTGYLPETPPLYPDMTVEDYLTFCARIKGVPRSERTSRLQSVMEKTQIADMRNRHCGKLSKGYRQRVGLAQALLHNPDVLILDEPTAGLDPKQQNETRRLIKGLGGDHTIILSTHILPEVSQTCNRIVIINRGQSRRRRHARQPDRPRARVGIDVRAGGRAWAQTQKGRCHQFQASRAYLCRTGVTGSSATRSKAKPAATCAAHLASTVVGHGWGLLELRPMRMSLEEIFLQIITTEEAAAAPEAAAEASHE